MACAQAMQQAMQSFDAFEVAPGVIATLAVKTVVASGPARRFLVGEPSIQVIDVLAGATLDRMAAAEQVAHQNEIVVDAATAAVLQGQAIVVSEWRAASDDARVAVLDLAEARVSAQPSVSESRTPLLRALLRVLPPCLPTKSDHGCCRQSTSACRATNSVFWPNCDRRLPCFSSSAGLDYDHDELAGAKLDAFVRWVQHVVARFEGVVIQLTTGDKGSYLYAAFGAPIAHDDDSVRAATAACELRIVPDHLAAVTDIHIGISQGMMRVGAYGGATRQTYGVLGDETNMAARLMSQAEPGQVLISQALARRVEDRFDLTSLGSRRFKGKADPQPVFALAGLRTQPPTHLSTLYRTPLVGRQHELEQLHELLDAVAGGAGRVARIEGDAGAGKSHLAAQFARQAGDRGLAVVVAACQSTEQTTAYYAGRQLARAMLGLSGRELQPLPEQIAHLETTLHTWNPAWLARLPLLGDLVGLPIENNRTTAALDARQRQEALISLLVDISVHTARQRPLLLLVEDAHWLDEASQGLVLALGRAIAAEPVLLVLVQRPPVAEQDPFAVALAELAHQTLLQLPELDAAGTAALVQERLRGQLDELALAFIHLQAQGNPFFTEELVDALREGGHLLPVAAGWRLSPGIGGGVAQGQLPGARGR